MNRTLFATLMLLSTAAGAQDADAPSGHSGAAGMTSVLSGKALGRGALVHVQLGWPGISAAVLTSASDRLDVGGSFSFLYGYEGITRMAGVPGVKVQGVGRLELYESGKINLGLSASPGVFFYFFQGGSEIGLAIPLELTLGFSVMPKLMLNGGIDVPVFAVFGPYGGLAIPVLIGGGLEYALDNRIGLTMNMRAGPSVPLTGYRYFSYWSGYWCYDFNGRPYPCGNAYYTVPAMEMLLGLSFRL
jgi:hypothetical protein